VRSHHQPTLGRIQVGVLADPEGIPHVACRVIGRHIEETEVVFIRLHVWPVVHLKAHFGKDRAVLAQVLCRDVQVADAGRPAGQRDVHGSHGKLCGQRFLFERLLACAEGRFKAGLDLVGRLAVGGTFFARQLADHVHGRGQRAALTAQVANAPRFERIRLGRRGQRLQRLCLQLAQVVVHKTLLNAKRALRLRDEVRVLTPRCHPGSSFPGEAALWPAARLYGLTGCPITGGRRGRLLCDREQSLSPARSGGNFVGVGAGRAYSPSRDPASLRSSPRLLSSVIALWLRQWRFSYGRIMPEAATVVKRRASSARPQSRQCHHLRHG